MLLMMIEKGMPIDEIIFCDTGKEFPAMYEHIAKVEEYIGRPITRLKAPKGFDYYFSEHIKTKGKNKGTKGYGWARMWVRWCTRVLKTDVTRRYLTNAGEYILYIGIAADEPKRHTSISDNEVHPLFDWGVTERQALEYCYSKGFDWGGLYENFKRVSCWCCPLQSIDCLRRLRKLYPSLWQELKEMDNKVPYKFKPDYSVEDLDLWFKYEEDNNLSPTRINKEILRKLKEGGV